VAKRPVVEKDVSSSTVNLAGDEIQNLPVTSVSSAVGLQAGIQGNVIRGGGSDQTAYMLNGLTLRDDRTNTSFSGISLTSLEEVQVQTGGFNAEYGSVRSGVVNMVTKEGKIDKYNFSFIGRYRPAGNKSFEDGPSSLNSYYIRPYIDDAVAWTGTRNGNWDTTLQRQYPYFQGWNSYVLNPGDNTYSGLTPEAARKLFLWQHRKDLTITKPDYDLDMALSGPIPVVGHELGDLRFLLAYRGSRTMYLIPLNTDSYSDYSIQGKITSDIAPGMKLSFDGLISGEQGTSSNSNGAPGMFVTNDDIAQVDFSKQSYGDSRIYSNDYWVPAEVKRKMLGGKFTNILSSNTYYEGIMNLMVTTYDKNPSSLRDQSLIYEIMPGYFTTEAPFGFEPFNSLSGIGSGMRMGGGGMSNARDTSQVITFNSRFDFESQFDHYNLFKAGFEFIYTDNNLRYGLVDYGVSKNSSTYNIYRNFPIKGALYAQDKIEYEGLIANVGLRVDYSDPNSDWYTLASLYDPNLSGGKVNSAALQNAKNEKIPVQVLFSPRLGVAFPITESSKLYFNYGHFLEVPTPDNLFLIRTDPSRQNAVSRLSDPGMPLQRTVAYELGYEQSIMDQFLIRAAGYYKDVSNESRLVSYYSNDGTVQYSINKPDLYEDIRGFELTLSKNRGSWISGFINYTYSAASHGDFNFDTYYQNPSLQRDYERTYLSDPNNLQTKPVPRPYARANIDLFTPDSDFGPSLEGFEPLTAWRLSILAYWTSGAYFTWTGGGTTIPGFQNNFQWTDYWDLDLRFSKDFKFGSFNIQLFADLYNVLNIRYLQRGDLTYGWVLNDFDNYMKSLHMPAGNIDPAFRYIDIPGNDKPGNYANPGSSFTPMQGVTSLSSLSPGTISTSYIYYETSTGRYAQYVNNQWVDVDKNRLNKILNDKSYIEMPKLDFFSFLNPRNIYFGVKVSMELF
jgi:outer membrane receptor protein involved in Fe transport